MTFKPMLADTIEDTSKLRFPVFASLKLDGVRATVQGGELLSRNLKPIKNKNVQAKFAGLPEGIDGELIVGDPAAKDEDGESMAFRNTTPVVMSHNEPADGCAFYIFDRFDDVLPFSTRYDLFSTGAKFVKIPDTHVVEQILINNEQELLAFEIDALELGYEGLMVRDPNGPYKQGRSTLKQGWLLKLKRFTHGECEILDTAELMHNENEAKTNELGRTQRSTHKAGMVPGGVLGKFLVRDLETGVEFEVGGGLKAHEREVYWRNRKAMVGQIIRYKYFPVGIKDKPRFPVFDGFRDKADM